LYEHSITILDFAILVEDTCL